MVSIYWHQRTGPRSIAAIPPPLPMHSLRRITLTAATLFVFLQSAPLFATPAKFTFSMIFESGSYDFDPSDGIDPEITGYFVIDDGLVDSNPAPNELYFAGPALLHVSGPGSSYTTAANFSVSFWPDDPKATVSLNSSLSLLSFSFEPWQTVPATLEEFMDPTKIWDGLEGGYVEHFTGLAGMSDNSSSIRFSEYLPSETVPDSLGLAPLAIVLGLLAWASRRFTPETAVTK